MPAKVIHASINVNFTRIIGCEKADRCQKFDLIRSVVIGASMRRTGAQVACCALVLHDFITWLPSNPRDGTVTNDGASFQVAAIAKGPPRHILAEKFLADFEGY